MAYNVVVAPSFEARLDEALHYRSTYFGHGSAHKLIAKLESIMSSLATTPALGTPLEAFDPHGRQLRWLLIEKYVAVYSIHEDDHTVVLLDLFFGSQNWREVIEGR